MNCDQQWKFSAPLRLVDVNRILEEAGPYAKCVRVNIGGEVFTFVNSKRVRKLPDPVSCVVHLPDIVSAHDGFALGPNIEMLRDDKGEITLLSVVKDLKETPRSKWYVYINDRTKEIVDRVKVSVEVFK